jgi:GTP diphosphokinase / guanosine-3',5'-bis(diphosphate) 3'-diphosphatase
LNRIVDWQAETSDPAVFMENLKTDLEQDEVFVFSPKGKVITLPVGSTPVDFAYAIHTEVGHRCIGSRVNGRLVPLDHQLNSGDACEIFTSKVESAGPSRDWLGFVVSPRARNKVRQWFTRERREDSLESGREDLQRELRRQGLPINRLLRSDTMAKEAESAGFGEMDALYVAIGEHHVSARSIAQRVSKALGSGDEGELMPATVPHTARRRKRPNASVHVEGLDDVMVRLSRCCTPVPGDEILGFVTRGRGVSVHRADCANAVSLATEQKARTVEVEWDNESADSVFVASVEVHALDRSGLLRDVAQAVSEHHLNIVGSSTHTGGDRISIMRFDIELADPGHLDAVLRTVKSVESVYDAYRLIPGGGRP